MGTDWFESHDDLESLHSRVLQVRSMSARSVQMVPQVDSWAHWNGGTVTDIYTDGSHAMDRTLGRFLLGKGSSKNGGGVILTDGRSWINQIFVRVDVEVKKAFQVELICILIANAIAVAQGGRVTIHSDCQAAIDVANGTWSMDFRNTISDWTKGRDVVVQKVRAHPERFAHYTNWTWDDKGICTAYRVAGENMAFECTVGAAHWLKRIGSKSRVVI